MGRRYNRYRKQQENPVSGLLVLLLIGGAFWVWKLVQDDHSILIWLIVFIIVTLLVIGVLVFWRLRRSKERKRALSIIDIDSIDPLLFEEYVATLLRDRGFTSVSLTERYDLGVDIVAVKNGIRWGVQVKRHKNTVKAEAVRQVFTALSTYKCSRAMVVTNSIYSRPARILAEANGCVLIDRSQLEDWIVSFQRKQPALDMNQN